MAQLRALIVLPKDPDSIPSDSQSSITLVLGNPKHFSDLCKLYMQAKYSQILSLKKPIMSVNSLLFAFLK